MERWMLKDGKCSHGHVDTSWIQMAVRTLFVYLDRTFDNTSLYTFTKPMQSPSRQQKAPCHEGSSIKMISKSPGSWHLFYTGWIKKKALPLGMRPEKMSLRKNSSTPLRDLSRTYTDHQPLFTWPQLSPTGRNLLCKKKTPILSSLIPVLEVWKWKRERASFSYIWRILSLSIMISIESSQ